MLEKLTEELQRTPFTMLMLVFVTLMVVDTAHDSATTADLARTTHLATSTLRQTIENSHYRELYELAAADDLARETLLILDLAQNVHGPNKMLDQRRVDIEKQLEKRARLRATIEARHASDLRKLERSITILVGPDKASGGGEPLWELF